jgi:hypothetical protein
MRTEEEVKATSHDVLQLLMARCANPRQLLDVLVPITAAALERTRAEPEDVRRFFLRVTALLDEHEAQKGSSRS